MITEKRQDQINRAVYSSRGVYRHYLSKDLSPPETACFLRFREQIAGRDVLDIGVGAGRTTRFLAPLARRYEAIDYSPPMVAYMKRVMPEISVRQADFRNLEPFDDNSFDFVLASNNVIDAFGHQDRLRALSEASRVLRSGGVLAFSSHNLRYKEAFGKPKLRWSSNPLRFGKRCFNFLAGWWNYFRVAPLRTITPEYALLNDPGHRYAILHYYASRATVEAQLAAAGMRLVSVFDSAGNLATEGEDDSDNPSLTYVAEKEKS